MRRLRDQDRTGCRSWSPTRSRSSSRASSTAIFGVDYVQLHASYVNSSVHVLGFYLPVHLPDRLRAGRRCCSRRSTTMLYRTKFGRAVRASLQNRTAADLIGINVNRMRTLSVGIGVAVTAVGGMVFGATNAFNPNSGYDLISRLLAIVILGGMGSIGGAMAAAVFLLVINDVVAVAWSPTWAPLVFFAALVLVLSIRPQGLFGSARPCGRNERRRAPRAGDAAARRASLAGRCSRVFPLCSPTRRPPRSPCSRWSSWSRPTAWNIFSGYSGYLALGHAVFFGCGGYAVALAARDWHVAGGWPVFALLPFGGLVAGADRDPGRAGRAAHAAAHLRRGHDRDLLHLPAGATNLGVHRRHLGDPAAARAVLGANYNQPFYYVALAILVLTVALSWGVRRSRFGLQLLAIRDDEDRALGLGVKTRRVKLTAFVISAFPVGMVGGLYFYFLGQIFPQFAFDPLFDISIALMAFLGGLGTLTGPLLGALVLESLQQYLTQTFSSNATYLIAYGVLFLVVILLLPRGVVPACASSLERPASAARRSGRQPSDAEAVAAASRGRRDEHLIEVEGVSKAYGGVQALCRLRPRGPRGRRSTA